MTTTETIERPAGAYPLDSGDLHYGLAVWMMGEEGDFWLVQGHGARRRALAAFSAAYRGLMGTRVLTDWPGVGTTEVWATVENNQDFDPGIDDWVWRIHAATEGAPGALAFTRVEPA